MSLGEANKDHKTDGKVHWKKFYLMGESILDMMRFQPSSSSSPTYHLEPNPFLLYFIGHESSLLSSTEDVGSFFLSLHRVEANFIKFFFSRTDMKNQ